MLDPDYLEHCADGIIELYAALDEDIARDIARRIVKAGEVTDTARWQMKILQESGVVFDDAIKSIAKYSGKGEKELRALFEKANAESLAFDNAIYTKAGLSPVSHMSPAVLQALEAGLKKTGGSLENLVMSTAVQAQNSYFSACDRAYLQVSSGAFDYITAIRNAIKSASAEGTSVLYPSGHVDKLDVAIRRAVITGVSQTALKVSEANADAVGCDLVEVTAHAGARPEHAAWQGKVYSRSGKNKKYPPFSVTGYGTGAGLGGWNCRHAFYPFFEGISTRAYTSERIEELNNKTVKYNDETMSVYDASQKQRAMERQMRKERRELAGIDEAIKSTSDNALKSGLKEDFEAAAVKLKNHEAQYTDFSSQVKLPTQRERLQVAGYGKSTSQKVVYKAKKHYDSWAFETGIDSVSSLAEYYRVKYNDKERYVLLKSYCKEVKKGNVSPLIGFSLYESTYSEANSALTGLVTQSGVKVSKVSMHCVGRIIGQRSADDAGAKGVRAGVKIADVVDAITTGKATTIRVSQYGHAQKFIGKKCAVSINTDSGVVIQVNPE